jgi:glycine betaine catabolism B
MSASFEVELIGQDACGADIRTLRFTRPAAYRFKAGQWFSLRLQTPDGVLAETFSHCSAPGDPYLELTTRISGSPFKRQLAALEPGARVTIVGPGGRLAVDGDQQRVVFLAGGVGITPIRSILRDAGDRARRFEDALLIYGNRDESCVPFAEELDALKRIGLRVVICYERPPVGWLGESGFISAETVRRHVDPDAGYLFVVTGPPVMVEAMERVLDDLAVSAEQRLVERFAPAR